MTQISSSVLMAGVEGMFEDRCWKANLCGFIFSKYKGYHNIPLRQFEMDEKAPYLCRCCVQTHQGMWMSHQMRQNEAKQSTDAQGPSVAGD